MTTTDAAAYITTIGKEIATSDGECATVDGTFSGRDFLAAADACRVGAAVGVDNATTDSDIGTAGILAAADACAVFAAMCFNGAACDGERTTVFRVFLFLSTADACRIGATVGIDRAAVDGDNATIAVLAPADTRTVLATVSFNTATVNNVSSK